METFPVPRRIWTDAEWDRLRKGATAGGWTASVEGDRLSLVQGGKTIYTTRLRRELVGWKITAAEVENDPASYRPGSPQEETARLQSVIERLVS